jgi:hypothetical protein
VQVDLGELLDHQVEAVGLVELLDLDLEAEALRRRRPLRRHRRGVPPWR